MNYGRFSQQKSTLPVAECELCDLHPSFTVRRVLETLHTGFITSFLESSGQILFRIKGEMKVIKQENRMVGFESALRARFVHENHLLLHRVQI